MKILPDGLIEIEVLTPCSNNIIRMKREWIKILRNDIIGAYDEFDNYFVRINGTVKPQDDKGFLAVIVTTYPMNELEYKDLKQYLADNPIKPKVASDKVTPTIKISNIVDQMEADTI